MVSYILRRLLAMIPVLGIILILSFCLFQYSGADPVRSLLAIRGISDNEDYRVDFNAAYKIAAKELSRDLPHFYFAIVPSYYPDTLHRLILPSKIKQAKNLLSQYKSWNNVSDYLNRLSDVTAFSNDPDISSPMKQAIFQYNKGIQLNEMEKIREAISDDLIQSTPSVQKSFSAFYKSQDALVLQKSKFFLPKFIYHGGENQFHQWFKRIISGDFGITMTDGRPVLTKLYKSLGWSIVLSLLSIFFAGILSILVGLLTAYKKGSLLDSSTYLVLFGIFSTPLFWFATLMIAFFTTKDFGAWTNIFPSVGLFYTGDGGLIHQLTYNFKLLILPIFCLSVQSSAFLGRQMRASILQQSTIPYYRTAIAKGMSKKTALVKHVLPNALLPFITLIIGAIPASFAGALVIEVLFNIPGTGRLMFQSILNNDWNMISAILIVISIATMAFYLIGDILYAYVNPKIKFDNE